jgi:hypothetical protein
MQLQAINLILKQNCAPHWGMRVWYNNRPISLEAAQGITTSTINIIGQVQKKIELELAA